MRVIRKHAPITIELETDREVQHFTKVLEAAATLEGVGAYLKERGLSAIVICDIADFLEDLRNRK